MGHETKRYLKTNNISDTCRIIDSYIDFIIELWKYGIGERTYNFTENFGIDSKGKTVLIDFGELTFSKDHISKKILERRWKKSWSFMFDISGELKSYYKSQMEQNLTVYNLDRYWCTKLSTKT